MLSCLYCKSALPDRALFCPSCSKQARCKSCKDFLEQNAKACVVCGVNVGEGNISSTINNSTSISARNTLILKETKISREVEVGFTDAAIGKISDALNHILIDRLSNPIVPSRGSSGSSLLLTGETTPERKDYVEVESLEDVKNGTTPLSQGAKSDQEKLHDIFHYNNNVLKLDYYNLKATGQLDAAKRLVYLFIYAHELEGRSTVTRDEINAVLKDIDLFDGNISNWISNTPDLASEGDESTPTLRLRKNGRDFAKEYLADVFNPEKKDEWKLTERTKSRKKTKSTDTDSDKQTGAKQLSDVDSWVTKWTQLKLDVDAFNAMKSASIENRGIIALWMIQKATSAEIKVVQGSKIALFILKALRQKYDGSNIGRYLEQKAQGKARRVKDGYELTDEGIKYAEEILKFESEPNTSANQTKKTK